MPVEDVFSITGRGTVATGRVERGSLKVGEEVEIVGLTDEKRKVVVTGIEMFRKLLDVAETGDNIGALLRGVQRDEIERGQVLSAPGTIHPHTKFKGEVYVLKKEEGGRHTPFFNGYRPQFYFRTTDVTGDLQLPEGTEMCMQMCIRDRVIFVAWNPIKGFFGGVLFGGLSILGLKFQAMGLGISQYLVDMIPYIATILIVIISTHKKRKESQPPGDLGNNYFREER